MTTGVALVNAKSRFVYVRFWSGELLPVDSIAAGKALVLTRHPSACFGKWETHGQFENLPAWPTLGAWLRFELGEKEDRYRPVAYVSRQDWELKVNFDD